MSIISSWFVGIWALCFLIPLLPYLFSLFNILKLEHSLYSWHITIHDSTDWETKVVILFSVQRPHHYIICGEFFQDGDINKGSTCYRLGVKQWGNCLWYVLENCKVTSKIRWKKNLGSKNAHSTHIKSIRMA